MGGSFSTPKPNWSWGSTPTKNPPPPPEPAKKGSEAKFTEAGDPFLTHAVGRLERKEDPRKKGRFGWIWDFLLGASLVLVPWAVFAIVSALFTFMYHASAMYVWLAVIFFFFFGIALMCSSAAKADEEKSSGSATQFFMGVLCLVALFFATCLGYYNYHMHMFAYWSLKANGEYTNLMPSEIALAVADAGKIVFSDGTRVDTTRAVGYEDGATYCVAPIADNVPIAKVQFWAVGTDCCAARADFNCDDAWSPKARSGVVVSDTNTWLPSHRASYLQAIRVAEATYEIKSAPEPLLVRWVADPAVLQDDLWRNGVGFLVAELGIYLLVSIIFGGVGLGAVKRAKINV